jgi:hypothetical protein
MKNHPQSTAATAVRALLLAAIAALSAACPSVVETEATAGSSGGHTTTTGPGGSTGSGVPPPPHVVDKIDLLLMIDNSRSMADKEEILAQSVPDLVGRIVNPPCVDASGVPSQGQPPGPLAPCSAGTKRAITPVLDVHVGVVTSSLGGHGSDSCMVKETQSCNGSPNPSNDDAGHLVHRKDPCGSGLVPTYQDKGYLAWDPAQKLNPPGESMVGDLGQNAGLVPSFRDLVLGAGQIGCGYESQLEGWYRFLVDTEPYQTISVMNGKVVTQGTDAVVLQQRAEFLRPDSLLLLVMLSDENDCSVKEYGQFFYALQQRNPSDPKKAFHLPRARQECAKNPNDPCCKSCAQKADNCPVDPMCTSSPTLSDQEDDINLRCWDQKRRYGIDFLYPVDRYTQALTSPTVPNEQGDLVENPLFSGPNSRDAGMVFTAGIVGVPWQDIAHDPSDITKGLMTASELSAKDGQGNDRWRVIIGDPANYAPPLDPHMIESYLPRSGTDPVNGVLLAPPNASPGADSINGHEYSIPKQDDLQYACIFPLAKPRDCTGGKLASCDCQATMNDNPLCDPNETTLQVRAKGYPGIRELSLLKSLGPQAVTTSICPVQMSDPSTQDFGYRPAMTAIAAAVYTRLTPAIN